MAVTGTGSAPPGGAQYPARPAEEAPRAPVQPQTRPPPREETARRSQVFRSPGPTAAQIRDRAGTVSGFVQDTAKRRPSTNIAPTGVPVAEMNPAHAKYAAKLDAKTGPVSGNGDGVAQASEFEARRSQLDSRGQELVKKFEQLVATLEDPGGSRVAKENALTSAGSLKQQIDEVAGEMAVLKETYEALAQDPRFGEGASGSAKAADESARSKDPAAPAAKPSFVPEPSALPPGAAPPTASQPAPLPPSAGAPHCGVVPGAQADGPARGVSIGALPQPGVPLSEFESKLPSGEGAQEVLDLAKRADAAGVRDGKLQYGEWMGALDALAKPPAGDPAQVQQAAEIVTAEVLKRNSSNELTLQQLAKTVDFIDPVGPNNLSNGEVSLEEIDKYEKRLNARPPADAEEAATRANVLRMLNELRDLIQKCVPSQ